MYILHRKDIKMSDIRLLTHSDHAKTFDKAQLIEHFLIQGLFKVNSIECTFNYS